MDMHVYLEIIVLFLASIVGYQVGWYYNVSDYYFFLNSR